MGQHIKYPERHERRKPTVGRVHRGEPSGVPYKCDPPIHRWRLNARQYDPCFCGAEGNPNRNAAEWEQLGRQQFGLKPGESL